MRVKEAPASALRAMFGGIGSLLGVTDKLRAKSATPETAAPETGAPETAAPETAAAAPETAVLETAAPETAAPETAAPETAAPETAAPETAAPETAAPETAVLPVANYDDLSLASLRARLRILSADQVVTLLAYEKSHADRADVVSMFERRIVKLSEV